ncbi:MAG: alpha/beta fold hydrolase [Brachybacterium sp.]|nr:alpha/beta fold hydrolase [Brachybacterium sp.]
MRAHPATGETVSVPAGDSRTLACRVWGPTVPGDPERRPLVVLEAGLGASAAFWGPVAAALAEDARVVAYDRAGYGGSTPASAPRDLDALASDLALVVDALRGDAERVVLVGHSWGGPIVRTEAARRRLTGAPIAGLVLVDPTDERDASYRSPGMRLQEAVQNRIYPLLARRRVLPRLVHRMLRGLPQPYLDEAVQDITTEQAAAAVVAENREAQAVLRSLTADPPDLGDLPVTIISGTRPAGGPRAMRATLIDAHRQSVDALPGGRHVLAERSGHLVPISEPGLVAEVVRGHLTG